MRYQIYEAKSVKYDAQQRVGIIKFPSIHPENSSYCWISGIFCCLVATNWLHFAFSSPRKCSQKPHRLSRRLATSTCLFGYRWLYVSIVVCTRSWPRRSAISSGEKPISTSRLAWLCPYGIITTNRKSPVYQGFSVIWQGFSSFSKPKNRAAK